MPSRKSWAWPYPHDHSEGSRVKIAVVSCMAYRDAWPAFVALFRKFWPDCPYQIEWWTDEKMPSASWCKVVATFAANQTEPILLMQEDFWLTAPVQTHLIEHALHELKSQHAAMIRLYPCPGSNEDYGDSHFGRIAKGTPYRVSCQASIWNPVMLTLVAALCGGKTPADFEIKGSEGSHDFEGPFLAFKRDVTPWPMEYLCSAISRGKWSQDAVKLAESVGVKLDLSVREVV